MIQSIISTLLTLPGIIIGLSFHEFAHAWMSDRLGDPTPRRQGRLTINPMAHIDPVGFIALLIARFGWGVPVEINPSYYKNRRRGELLVGFAGVAMNLYLAVVFAVLTRLVNGFAISTGNSEIMQMIVQIFYNVVVINLCLMIFNLLPVPPLDGFGILTQLFRLERYSWYYSVMRYAPFILLLIILTNIHEIILIPVLNLFLGILM